MIELIIFAVIVGIIFLIRRPDFLNTWDAWEIKEGKHHSRRTGHLPKSLSLKDGRHLKFGAYFTDSCLYPIESDDINKLYGFTDANSLVHDNSVRFGWRPNGVGAIEIFAYWYSSGKRLFQKLGETVPYQKDEYEIWARDNEYYFRFNKVELIAERTVKTEHGIRARLYPYFGGDKPAPHDIQIFINEHN